MFSRYQFESRSSVRRLAVGRWSYLWAGLLGPVYVLSNGGGWYVLHALALSAGLTLAPALTIAAPMSAPSARQRATMGRLGGRLITAMPRFKIFLAASQYTARTGRSWAQLL